MEKFLTGICLCCLLLSGCRKEETNPDVKEYRIGNLTIYFGNYYEVNAYDPQASGYYWDDASASYGKEISQVSRYTFGDTGLFRVVVYYSSDSLVYKIRVIGIHEYIPNSFTPNGDGLNDYFKINITPCAEFKLKLYTQEHVLVYQSDDFEKHGWDGKFKDKYLNAGTYVYNLYYSYTPELFFNKKGFVTLVR